MTGFIRLFSILCAAALLSGCTQVTDTITRTFLGEGAAITDRVVDHVLDRDEAGLRSLAHREITPQFSTVAVSAMLETLPDAAATRRVIVESSHAVGGENAPTETRFTYRVDFEPDEDGRPRATFIQITLAEQGDSVPQLVGLTVFPVPPPVYDGVSQWPAGFWIALVLTPATALFCLAALVSAWRTPRVKRRILWSLFIVLIGYPILGFSTETGGWGLVSPSVTADGGLVFQFFQFALFSASWMNEPVTGHHVFHIALPVGALLFFLQKRGGWLALKPQKGEQKRDDTLPDAPTNRVSP